MGNARCILVMRHAKSDWGDPGLDDHSRPLNLRGQRDAPRMARWLIQSNRAPDCIVASSAVRAMETAEAVAQAVPSGVSVQKVPELYLAGPETYMSVIKGLADEVHRPLVIGHNPGIEEWIEILTGESVEMSTAAVAELKVFAQTWTEFARQPKTKLKNVWKPKALPDDFE
jgi:phosphohistidine phosphatase